MIPQKTTFVQLNKKKLKKIVLFGSGNIAKKTIRKMGTSNIECIVDNSVNLQGTKYLDLEIYAPEILRSKDAFIIICSTAITEISAQLSSFGLTADKDYTISPILNDLIAISDLEALHAEFIFTSGTPASDEPLRGGGLYSCKVQEESVSLEKIYAGPCYGAIQRDDSVFFIDTDKGLMEYKGGKVSLVCELPKGSRAHGISFNQSNDRFYVSCSDTDSILEISINYKILRELKISDRKDSVGHAVHHTNDNYAVGNSLYVSMFSSTGSWQRDVFDGCIAEFDIKTGERLQDICSDLYMPHNVKIYDGSIHILDSLPGHLRYNNLSVQGTFPAFTRGLDYNAGLYYIGQSKNRNYSKVLGLSNNISIDCGVIVFNPELKASRFIQFPYSIGEIHSIVHI